MSLPTIVSQEEWTAARRSYYFLDLTALGRQEDWEQPTGRTANARSNQPDFTS